MSKNYLSKGEKILCKNLDRESIYQLFLRDNTTSIDVDEINDISNHANFTLNEYEIRYKPEKLLFLNLLMDSDLGNQIERRKNAKYDYMIGLLLFIASNPHFKYGFGYFGDQIKSFDNFLKNWCEFLNAVIIDINALPSLQNPALITIECEEFIEIIISQGFVIGVKINLNNFNKLFRTWSKEYNFNLVIDKVIYEASISDGSGHNSNLYKKFIELNNIFDTYSSKHDILINYSHDF